MTDNPTDTPASTDIVPDWLIPSRVYDILKWLGLIVLPAL
ncbi:holin, partial [Bifidobacterium longum]